MSVSNLLIRIQKKFIQNFSLDLRALGLMRMGIALIILIDLIIRSSSLVAFYTDEGVLPLSVLYKSNWNPSFFSIYAIGTGWKIIALLFSVNAIFAFLLLLGFHTRLMTFLCWFMLVSLHNRNPLILQGGDELLRLTLFWGFFLPWGKCYSVDSLLISSKKECENKNQWIDWGGIGFIALLFSVYFFSGMLKNSSEWTTDGTALYYALSLDQITWPAGKFIYQYPALLKALTFTTYSIELVAPFLLLIPFKTRYFRLIFILVIGTLHLGISIVLFVGLFYLIGLITLIGLLPENAMNMIEGRSSGIRFHSRKIFAAFAKYIGTKIQIAFQPLFQLSELTRFQLRLLYGGILAFIVCFNLLWCIGQLPKSRLKVNDNFLWLAYVFRFDQDWGMFAPRVYKNDGWYVYEAALENSSASEKVIDLNRNGTVIDYSKPKNLLTLYPDDRWRKFGELWQYQPDKVKKEFCRYLRNKWNREHPEKRIATLKIIYMQETSLPDYKQSEIVPVMQCDCEKWKN